MRKLFTFLLSVLGLNTACSQQNYESRDVSGFADLLRQADVTLLDLRTADEYGSGHIAGAINIDVKGDDFMERSTHELSKEHTIAVYCRSGRRSANACGMLTEAGFKVVNLKGGIEEWKSQKLAVTTDTHEVDRFLTKSGKEVQFHALLHASIRIVYDGLEIEVDPVLKLGNRTTDYSSYPKAAYLFVTHEHGDHFDKEAIKVLSSEQTTLVTNKRCGDMLGYGTVMANGERQQLRDDIEVEAVPAYNTTEGHLQFHPKGRDNGYILTIDGLRIYIAGDTEDIPEMESIKDIDIAFLPCNQPYTMTCNQLVKAARTIKPKVLFPYHFGQTDVKGIPAQLKSEGIDVRLRHYE